jgi:hypothetical protein
MNRRAFLSLAGAGIAGTVVASRVDGAKRSKQFEVSASLYAWEVHDEGVERVLDNLQELSAVNSVYLLGVMHPESRPFGGATFPHNPVRKTWQAEDARCYWHPDGTKYGRVRPRLSDHAWLNETDWLRVLANSARKRGIKVGVEFSHSLIDRERMAGEFADLAQRNVHGEVAREGTIAWVQPPCPNHPAIREFALAMATDVVANHGVDYVQSCIMSFDPALPKRGGGCFCVHCQRFAQEIGVDLEKTRRVLLENPDAETALKEWRIVREASVVRFYRTLHDGVHALKPSIDLRYNVHSRSYANYGVNLPKLRSNVDSMRLMDYSEQEGNPALLEGKRKWLMDARSQVGADFPLLSAVGVRLKATADVVRDGVKVVVETGMNGLTIGHYDGATFPVLRGVRDGLVAAGVGG